MLVRFIRKGLMTNALGLLVLGIISSNSFVRSAKAGENPIEVNLRDALVDNLDITSGASNDERATIKILLHKGTNIDAQGNRTTVWFILTDISDMNLSERMGLSFSGVLASTPSAAISQATLTGDIDGIGGNWTFFGDLPNNVETGLPGANNDYSPLREVTIGGKPVIVNAIFIKWGDNPGEHLRVDNSCVSFPDNPVNTNCPYNGATPGDPVMSGHVLNIDTTSLSPSVTFKIHRELFNHYLSYYIVTDAYPAGPAKMMGVPFVPKDGLLGNKAGALIQSLPPALSGGNNLAGGGPLGGQSGLPAYFMPGNDYTPMWHIGFIRWNIPQISEIRSIKEAFDLQEKGFLSIFEFNPQSPPVGHNPIQFDSNDPNPSHVVNCPALITVDRHRL